MTVSRQHQRFLEQIHRARALREESTPTPKCARVAAPRPNAKLDLLRLPSGFVPAPSRDQLMRGR